MAILRFLGSSSSGNCSVLEVGENRLILDLGIDFKDVLKVINYDKGLKGVRGCFATHL